jgi:hypothetical protein
MSKNSDKTCEARRAESLLTGGLRPGPAHLCLGESFALDVPKCILKTRGNRMFAFAGAGAEGIGGGRARRTDALEDSGR